MYSKIKNALIASTIVLLSACGGGGGGAAVTQLVAAEVNLGGALTGLGIGSSLTLRNNGSDLLTLAGNGAFRFTTAVAATGTNYAITVDTQPAGQTCTVNNATGTTNNSDINNVNVVCSGLTFTVGGAISGLASAKNVTLLINGTDAASITANGSFSFLTPVAYGTNYAITVDTQPAGQTCTVNNATGNNTTANINDVNVLCHTLVATVSTLAGSGLNGHDDGTGAAASFYYPIGVAVDSNGNVYVADNFNNSVRKISSNGVVITIPAGFNRPSGVAVDTNGNVYVADTGNYKIWKITSSFVVTTLAGSGSMGTADGIGSAASFSSPYGIAVDINGNVFVSDYGSNKIRKITSSGVVTTLAGGGANSSVDGTGAAASFSSPLSVAVDSNGNVYVADYGSSKIRKITSLGVVTTLAGSVVGNSDGIGNLASFNWPSGVAVDYNGNVFVADSRNQKIRKITPSGEVTTVAGSGAVGSTDGTSAASSFSGPAGVAVDSNGNVYVADTDNSKIRKITFQ